jgi:hypothetical protein
MNYKKQTMEEVRERREFTHRGMVYSAQRLDILIVSICGAGIYIYFELLKYLLKEELCGHWVVSAFGIFFTFGLCFNFLAQWLAARTHYYDYLYCQQRIECKDKPNKEEQDNINISDNKSNKYDKLRHYTDGISMGLMFLGLGCLMSYFLFIF